MWASAEDSLEHEFSTSEIVQGGKAEGTPLIGFISAF